jgi:hypothetical protein
VKEKTAMSGKQGLYFSYGGLTLYLILAGCFFLAKDKEHGLMFLCGSIVWIISAFVWGKNANDGT